jgi:predicted dehydrogenase
MTRNPKTPRKEQTHYLTRRQFLIRTGLTLAAVPAVVPASARGQVGRPSPSNRIVIGCIGTGSQGRGDMSNFLNQKDAQVVAVCDVKTDQADQARAMVNERYHNQDCSTYKDFREIVARKDIDGFLVATPDHWHVLVALAAIRAGKDVYLEKPLSLRLEEDWALRAEVHRRKAVFQLGTQQRSSRLFRLACELVRNGRIGKLRHINVWAPGSAPGGSTEIVPPPADLDYDFWLGPAPFHPYTQDLVTPDTTARTWWSFSHYTLGFITGWGIHPMDIAAWGAGDLLNGPLEIEGRGSFQAYGMCDTACVWDIQMKAASGVTISFIGVPNGSNSGLPTCDTWPQREDFKKRYRRITSHGTAFEGTDGWVHVDRDGINLQPENLIDEKEESFKTRLASSPDHVRNFLDSIKNRAATVCPIDDAVWSDTLCHLGEAAIRLNRKVVWDTAKERFVNDDEANLRLRARPMRNPWWL